MNYCYLCGNELTNENDHAEHIFQQAIGGTLAVKGILCKDCGNTLGKDIDVNFTKIFVNYTSRLPINFDRKSENNIKSEICWAYFPKFEKTLECQMNKNNISVIQPYAFLHQNTFFIICPIKWEDKIINNYVKSQKKKLNIGDNIPLDIIQDCSNLEYVIEMPIKLNNLYLKKGIAKIAIGFSTYHAINRENLELALDIHNNKIHDKLYVIPYYPTHFMEQAIEELRFDTSNLDDLSHQIKLFNINNILICYIELFGTFQFQIILSEKYEGEQINYSYMQPLFQIKRKELKEMLHPSDMLLYQHYLPPNYNMNTPTLLKDINNGIRTKNQELSLDEYYENLLSTIYHNFIFLETNTELIEYENLKEFLVKHRESIAEKKYEILKSFKILFNNIYLIKTQPIQKFNKDIAYNHNTKKLKKLERMIKEIHHKKHIDSIYKTDF